jgi:hypothetical protein
MKRHPFIPPRLTAACIIIAAAAAIGISLVRDISQHEQIDRLQADNTVLAEQVDWFSGVWHDRPPLIIWGNGIW